MNDVNGLLSIQDSVANTYPSMSFECEGTSDALLSFVICGSILARRSILAAELYYVFQLEELGKREGDIRGYIRIVRR